MDISGAEHTGTTGSVFFAGAAGTPTEDNSNLFWNDTNNRLGIGINNPVSSLHIMGDINTGGSDTRLLRFRNAADNDHASLGILNGGLVLSGHSAATNSGSQHVFIENGGDVGIGTINPNQQLDVQGNIMHTGDMMSRGATYTSSWMRFQEHQFGNSLVLGSGGRTILGGGEFATTAQSNFSISGEDLILGSDSNISFYTNTQSGWASNIHAMQITNTGNVGIGTASPNEKLEVNGNIRMTDGNEGAGKIMVSDANGTASWANTSAVSLIKAMGKVASNGTAIKILGATVTRINMGDYQVTFNTAMPDANYIIQLTQPDRNGAGNDDPGITYYNQTTTGFRVNIGDNDDGGGDRDDYDSEFMFSILDF